MKYSDIQEGEYTARAVRAVAGRSKAKQTPYIEVEFHIPNLDCNIRWTGYLTEKTKERTLDTMGILSWDGDSSFLEGSIDTDKTVSLTIIRETGSDFIERPRVNWVNDPDRPRASSFENDASALTGMNLKAEMAARKASKKSPAAPKFDDGESIPF